MLFAHQVVAEYPKVANLVGRVGDIPSIKNYMETRPVLGQENKDLLHLYKNIYQILNAGQFNLITFPVQIIH